MPPLQLLPSSHAAAAADASWKSRRGDGGGRSGQRRPPHPDEETAESLSAVVRSQVDPLLFLPLPLAVKSDVGSEICFFCVFFLVFEPRLRGGKLAHRLADAEPADGVVEELETAIFIIAYIIL